MLNYLLFIKISPISLYPVYPSISYLFSLSLCLCLLCSILSAIHNLRLFKYLCQYSLFHHRRASSSFKHNTSFVARLPTIRRHKSQTIQTPGPDGSTLAKPPSSSRASTRYTRTIRDINASVENLGKLASGQARLAPPFIPFLLHWWCWVLLKIASAVVMKFQYRSTVITLTISVCTLRKSSQIQTPS